MVEWLRDAGFTTAWLTAVILVAGRLVRIAVEKRVEKTVEKKFREWEVRFSTFHGRLVEAMETIRRALAEAIEAVDTYRSLSQVRVSADIHNEYVEVQRALRTAKLEFEARSFYFDPDARETIRGVYDGLIEAFVGVRLQLLAEEKGKELPQEREKMLADVAARLEKAAVALDEQFRTLAGAPPSRRVEEQGGDGA